MITFLSFIWDFKPEIFYGWDFPILGNIRYYGLLWALSFICAHYIMDRVYKLEKRNIKEIDSLFIYTLVGCIAGARLGHCLFYGPYFDQFDALGHLIQEGYLSHPLKILMINEGGLASHGAGFGLLLACYLFYRKFKTPSYAWVIDRVALTVALAGALIRIGNFTNSEIIGKPSDSAWSVAFVHETERMLDNYYPESIEEITYTDASGQMEYQGATLRAKMMTIKLVKDKVSQEAQANLFNYVDQNNSAGDPDNRHFIVSNEEATLKGNSISKKVYLITRHPSQLYEAASCVVIFILMAFIYFQVYKGNTPDGLLIGIFMVGVFTLRFFYEFTKESQVADRSDWDLNTGQWLSFPMVAFGIYCIINALRTKKTE